MFQIGRIKGPVSTPKYYQPQVQYHYQFYRKSGQKVQNLAPKNSKFGQKNQNLVKKLKMFSMAKTEKMANMNLKNTEFAENVMIVLKRSISRTNFPNRSKVLELCITKF